MSTRLHVRTSGSNLCWRSASTLDSVVTGRAHYISVSSRRGSTRINAMYRVLGHTLIRARAAQLDKWLEI
ncbi:hypothetical protein DPMN_147139 [Dreissena polymorpha]|uniref:Uncharacterized protein n=1 Tax=Dreissena polymorpha TaxID=45954 RepID=A0A9D4J0D3_DREPO|nr:hypothetical protein DPMN_147139 [Dreissena polymorpha]